MRSTAQRWTLLIAFSMVSLVAAAVLGFVALLLGSDFAASETASPTGSFVLWVLTGVCLAAPVAALPSIGFVIRRRTTWVCAGAIAAVVAVLGVVVLSQP